MAFPDTNVHVPSRLATFCARCSKALKDLDSYRTGIDFVQAEMPELLLDRELFATLMKNIAEGKGYPDIYRPTIFDNELLLYSDASGSFSLRLYLWGPGEFTLPHDHNSWGVLGTAVDGFEVINYRREDDGSREGYARLREVERMLLPPGGVTFTLPFEEGIHTTGTPGDKTVITLNLYGKPLPRGYIQNFDLEKNRVRKVLPPWKKKEALSARALEEFM
jgi:predicted metal-dependent enzyme (double-stranded beta helix superfamily)